MTIQISPKNWKILHTYVQECSTELSGYGYFNPKTMTIEKIFPLFPQRCSSSYTEIDDKAMVKMALDPQTRKVNFWWHSHVNMGCTPSQTDHSFINDYGKTGELLVTLILNKKGEYYCRLDLFKPVKVYVTNIIVDPSFQLSHEEERGIKQAIDKNVKSFSKPAEKRYLAPAPFRSEKEYWDSIRKDHEEWKKADKEYQESILTPDEQEYYDDLIGGK